MPELIVHTAGETHRIPFEGEPVLHELIAHLPDAPSRICGGTGCCGQCAVVAAGALSPLPDASGSVLACGTRAVGDAEVWLPRRRTITRIETRIPELDGPLQPVDGQYAAAVDLGTTTIALQLIRLSDGKALSVVSCENPQRMVAADVIGRIENAMAGGLGPLKSLAHTAIDALEAAAFSQAGIPSMRADIRVIAGNTTMLYLYSGRNPESLSAAPFEADCLFGMREGRDLLPACAGAFVGADITCALLASGMCSRPQTAMLVDIGTNGEIALWHNGRLSCCATAAGPAFEGSGISCGTGSVPGAIDSVELRDGQPVFSTIDDLPPVGVCGSGLIDLIAALLDCEELDETGSLEEDFPLGEDLFLTQKDVRQVQLAKGAIAAGIRTLLHHAGISCADVDVLYIAGGFGSHIRLERAARIGLIPAELAKKTVVLGNASLGGAAQLLRNRSAMDEANRIARMAECLNLAADPTFSNAFVECMLFEE